MNSYIILTERLGLRRWLNSDIDSFIRMNKDNVVMKYFPKTFTDEETFEMIRKINSHFEINHFGLFAVEIKSAREFIGFTGFAISTF